MRIAFIYIFAFVAVTVAAKGPGNTDTKGDVFPEDTWMIADTPEQLGWSPEKLRDAKAFSNRIGTAAVMIVDKGIVVDQWGGVSSKYPIHSIRKPLMSALVGIHVHENRIDLSKTLEQLGIDDIAPSLTRAEKQATIADLLKSRSGVYHPALGEIELMKQLRPKRGSHPPGTFWYYNNWDFNALGTIFEKETGTKIFEEFVDRIAGPLQMEDFSLGHGKYIGGTASMHRVYAFRMSARDLARFGLLYLREGKWKDRQIVPSSWVRESTATHTDLGRGHGYGYMWRTAVNGGLTPNVQLKDSCFFHSGAGLHFLIVIPYRDLVIVHRVNTDAEGPYPQLHQIGRLFWMILDAAGEKQIGDNPSLETAQGLRLKGKDLKATFTANSFRVHIPTYLIEGDDPSYTLRFEADQTVSLSSKNGTNIRGKWSATDNACCLEMAYATGCYAVYKEQGFLKFYDATDTLFARVRMLGQ